MKYALLAATILGYVVASSQAQAQQFFPRNGGNNFVGNNGVRYELLQATLDQRAANRADNSARNDEGLASADLLAANRAARDGDFRLARLDQQAAQREERLANFELALARSDERAERIAIRLASFDERHFPPAPPHHHHGGSPD